MPVNNNCSFLGRLTKEPEMSQGNTLVARFSLAVERLWNAGNEQSADFLNMTAFGKTAENIEKYVHKGTELLISCHYQSGSYTNKDGQKVYTHNFIVDSFRMVGSPNRSSNAPAGNNGSQPVPQNAPAGNNGSQPVPDNNQNSDDLPPWMR